MAILRNLNDLSREQLIEQMIAMQKAQERRISMKVTQERRNEKTGKMEGTNGAVSVYGLGRFPITLYRSQWERLLSASNDIAAFIEANAHLLATKD